MKHSIVLRFKILSVLIISLLLTGCAPGNANEKRITRSGFYFDTLISISIYDSDDEALLNECFDMCSYYEDLLSMTVEGSDISRINSASDEPVYVSADTIALLNEAEKYRDLSSGLLDISMAPLTQFWTKARNEERLPDKSEVDALLKHTGSDKINIDSKNLSVSKNDPEAGLDIGAYGKGFVADKLKEMLVSRGVRSAVISLGGNILTIGSKPDGSDFHIGVKKPFGQADEVALSLNVSDRSVVTSGIYERYFIKDDVIYHHILDPRTGYPSDTDLISVTVISDSSLDGDALSTACLLLGLDNAASLIENTPGVEAIFITKDNKLHYTGGASSYITDRTGL